MVKDEGDEDEGGSKTRGVKDEGDQRLGGSKRGESKTRTLEDVAG